MFGVLRGSDPELAKEHVVFTAHHDHIGMAAQRDGNGDNIFNGAIDNASGTASLLTIAKAFASMKERPKRSILFAFVGSEEQGLLGAKYLAENPPFPAGYMAAVLNIDGIKLLGRTYDLSIVGDGKSNLDPLVMQVAKWQKRTVTPDLYPDRGYYYHSDHFSLAQVGVPGVYLDSGFNFIGRTDGWGKHQFEEWTKKSTTSQAMNTVRTRTWRERSKTLSCCFRKARLSPIKIRCQSGLLATNLRWQARRPSRNESNAFSTNADFPKSASVSICSRQLMR